jgi:hypothetical protein
LTLPWKDPDQVVLNFMHHLERDQGALRMYYDTVIQEQLENGIVQVVENPKKSGRRIITYRITQWSREMRALPI